MHVQVKQYSPTALLQPYIHSYRQGTFNMAALDRLSLQVVPQGYIDLIIHLDNNHCDLFFDNGWKRSPDFTLIGLWTMPYTVRFQQKTDVFWIRFNPEGMYALLGISATDIARTKAAVDEPAGNLIHNLCEQVRSITDTTQRLDLVEAFFTKQLKKREKDHHRYIQVAADLIRKNKEITIDALSKLVYISQRQLERGFKEKIGMSPKMYLRIARIGEAHRLLQADRKINFARLSYQLGYSDQAHFIREFKNFTGETPAMYMQGREKTFVPV